MSQHEEYTSPPGFRVSGGGGTKLAPILIDPTTPLSTGYTLVFSGTMWVPQVPGVRHVDVPISEAELKNLHVVSKTLIAAPGAGHVVEPVQITVERLAGTAYTVPGGNFFEFGYPDGVAGQVLVSFDPTRLLGSFTSGNRGFVQLAPSVGSNYWANPDTIVNTFDDKANQPFGVALDSAVTDGTGGLIMHVLYRVL
jgi:hypothetical protein